MRIVTAFLPAVCLAGCGAFDVTDEVGIKQDKLPNGTRFNCETMRSDVELLKGLMFRDSLPPERGMLFVHFKEDRYPYWMYQTKIPLDIIWMDHDRHILEMSENTPPCT